MVMSLRIHIMPIGFTPEVFTVKDGPLVELVLKSKTGPLVEVGTDKIITLHTRLNEEDNEIKAKVDKTINKLRETFPSIPLEEELIEEGSFMSAVKYCIRLLNRFGNSDQIFVHLGGGERHLGLALTYASFFSNNQIMLLPVLEYGIGNKKQFKYEQIPPLKPVEISDSNKKILQLVAEKDGQTLTEISKRISKNGDATTIAPSVFRHLKKLKECNLVDFDSTEKKYHPTKLSSLFIA